MHYNYNALQNTMHKIQCRPPLVQLQLYEDWFYPKNEARSCPAIVKKWKKHVSDNIEHPDMILWTLRPTFEKKILEPPNHFHTLDKYIRDCAF